jgi:hypothetical protein
MSPDKQQGGHREEAELAARLGASSFLLHLHRLQQDFPRGAPARGNGRRAQPLWHGGNGADPSNSHSGGATAGSAATSVRSSHLPRD